MPFWGRFDHFRIAVDSVLSQRDEDWHLYVVDDLYPDSEPGTWVQGLGDARITYSRNLTNLGPSRNYNHAVSFSHAEFVTILGCDDRMRPDYVARMKELCATYPTADLIQPGVEIIDASGEAHLPLADRVKRWIAPHGPLPVELSGQPLAKSLLRGNWTYFPSLVWRRSWLAQREFRADLDVVQDLEMLLHIVSSGGRMVVDGQVVFDYRRHASSVSSLTGTDGSKFRQERTVFREADERLSALGWTHAARAARWHALSRMHAVVAALGAIRGRSATGLRSLARHAFGR